MSPSRARIAVLATLDTKGEEARFVADHVAARSCVPVLVDLGLRGDAPADLDRAAIAAGAGSSLEALERLDKTEQMRTVAAGAASLLGAMVAARELDGAIAVGGGQGTWLAGAVLRELPLIVPKMIVTTIAQRSSLHVGASDIVIVPSITDISGLNRILRPVLSGAAFAICAMAESRAIPPAGERPLVAVTMFGVTTPGVEATRARLEEAGYEVAVFHANGVGGRTLESLCAEGAFVGVVDLTTTELADELVSGYATAGPHRLEAAGARGLRQVVVPGAIDVVNFGPPETVPARFAGRVFHQHTPAATLMRTDARESATLGELVAQKLNRAIGPVAVVIPRGGFSLLDVAGGPFFDPDADAAFTEALRAHLRAEIPVIESPAEVNAPAFAQLVVETYLGL